MEAYYLSQKDERSDPTFRDTIGTLLSDDDPDSRRADDPLTDARTEREEAQRSPEDPNFATSQQSNPLAADDLRERAADAPRTDKQGDIAPPHRTAGRDSEQGGI